jgi:hypothetical protein
MKHWLGALTVARFLSARQFFFQSLPIRGAGQSISPRLPSTLQRNRASPLAGSAEYESRFHRLAEYWGTSNELSTGVACALRWGRAG